MNLSFLLMQDWDNGSYSRVGHNAVYVPIMLYWLHGDNCIKPIMRNWILATFFN